MSERERARVEVERPRCPYCREGVGADDEKTGCGSCMAWHHRACWTEHGRCAACGATEAAGAAPVRSTPPAAAELVAAARRAARARTTIDLDPFERHQRQVGLMIAAIGAANVLLFGAFLAWGLLGGPDLVALSSMFVALGGGLAWWGLRLARRPRVTRPRDAKGS